MNRGWIYLSIIRTSSRKCVMDRMYMDCQNKDQNGYSTSSTLRMATSCWIIDVLSIWEIRGRSAKSRKNETKNNCLVRKKIFFNVIAVCVDIPSLTSYYFAKPFRIMRFLQSFNISICHINDLFAAESRTTETFIQVLKWQMVAKG